MTKPVAVILLNWNAHELTANCIRSLLKHSDTRLFDIIVADNGSADGSPDKLREQFPDLHYIDNNANLGFAGGNNAALRYSIGAGYEFSLIINNDTVAEEDIVTPLVKHLRGHTNVAAVQPLIRFLGQKDKIWNGGSGFNDVFGYAYSATGAPEPREVEWVTGCCFLVRNEVLQKTGLFNEGYFLYYEDTDLSFRIREKGYKLHFLPSATLYHEAGASGKTSSNGEGTLNPLIHYYTSRNRIWFLRQHSQRRFAPFICGYQLFYFSSVLFYFILRRRHRKARQLLRGISDGLFKHVPKAG
ncbi:MAG TPA: glycosyltransferase family 2 protein [Sphingobacteriaceae bacterium]